MRDGIRLHHPLQTRCRRGRPSCAYLQHGEVAQWEVSEAGDVEEGDLVSALAEVTPRQLNWRPQIPDLQPMTPLLATGMLPSQQLRHLTEPPLRLVKNAF